MEWYGINLRWAYSELLPTIYRHIVCKQGALDILHDALIRFALAKNPNRLEQPHAYLQVIVRNQLINEFNISKRFTSLDAESGASDESSQVGLLNSDVFFTPSAEHLADIRQRLQATQRLIENLSPRCQKAFWLFRIEGMNQSQIAEVLGVSVNMVQRYVARAMVELAEAEELVH